MFPDYINLVYSDILLLLITQFFLDLFQIRKWFDSIIFTGIKMDKVLKFWTISDKTSHTIDDQSSK